MTSNQIAYNEHLENVRHNKAVEGETQRHNIAYESETNRHNIVSERQGWASIFESHRHNVRSENITSLANKQQYLLGLQNVRSQYRIAQLNARTNLVTASMRSAVSRYSADVSRYNALLNARVQQIVAGMQTSISAQNAQLSSQTQLQVTRLRNANDIALQQLRDENAYKRVTLQEIGATGREAMRDITQLVNTLIHEGVQTNVKTKKVSQQSTETEGERWFRELSESLTQQGL